MDCPICRKPYDYKQIVPLSCKCGRTFCKSCIKSQSSPSGFLCPSCKSLTKIDAMWINRGLDTIRDEIYSLRQRHEKVIKPSLKQNLGTLSTREISSTSSYTNLENNCVCAEDKCFYVGPDCEKKEAQTLASYILLEKLSERQLCVNIKWSKCFMVPLYFILVAPWV